MKTLSDLLKDKMKELDISSMSEFYRFFSHWAVETNHFACPKHDTFMPYVKGTAVPKADKYLETFADFLSMDYTEMKAICQYSKNATLDDKVYLLANCGDPEILMASSNFNTIKDAAINLAIHNSNCRYCITEMSGSNKRPIGYAFWDEILHSFLYADVLNKGGI